MCQRKGLFIETTANVPSVGSVHVVCLKTKQVKKVRVCVCVCVCVFAGLDVGLRFRLETQWWMVDWAVANMDRSDHFF